MADVDEAPSIPEVESMILSLYEPVPPETITQVQEALHRFQRSPRGWRLARDLLARPDEKVRFFGALTLVVKLNTDSSSLGPTDLEELLVSLLGWTVGSALEKPVGLVTRKLSTALVTFFLRFPQHLGGSIRRLIFCLHWRQNTVPDEDVEIAAILAAVDDRMLQTAILFATDLVEEAGKVDMNSAEHFGIYEGLRDCLPDAVALISSGLTVTSRGPHSDVLRECSLKSLQAWISFSHRILPRGDPLVDRLRSLVPTVLDIIAASEGTFTASMELFTELLSNQQGFLSWTQVDSLIELCESDVGAQLYNQMVQGDFSFESCQYGFFILALGESRLETLVSARDAGSQRLLELLCGLVAAQGYPVAEDTIFVAAVEFWSSFTEAICDSQYADGAEEAAVDLSAAVSQATRAVQAACRKIVFPPPATVARWDSTERDGFADARKDVADLLQSMYSVSGPSLATMFADLIPRAVSEGAWAELEAAAFCLGSLADCIAGEATCDNALAGVFSKDLLGLLGRENANIASRTRQTCIALIEKFATYFERNTANLPEALDLLFSVLDDPVLAGPASKSIYRLCSSCRSALVSEVGAFLAAYRSIFSERQVDCLVRERVMGGIASVVQAMPTEHDRLVAVEQLLDVLCIDAQRCLQAAKSAGPQTQADAASLASCGPRCLGSATPEDITLHASLRVLRCLVTLAKGLQAPADSFLDLEASSTPAHAQDRPNPAIAATQSRIMTIMTELQAAFSTSGEVVEAICGALRAGFAESLPGPFVFSSATIADYLVRQSYSTPRIGALVSTACSFVNSHAARGPGGYSDIGRVLVWVIGLLHELADADADPELAQNGIDFVCRLLVRDAGLVMMLEPASLVSFFFSFALGVLDGREPLPKATAAEFWATFISCKPSSDASGLVPRAMAELGPAVTLSLIRNIGGNASRSELDKLSDPVKKLAAQHVMAASWIEAALFDPSFPSQKVSDEDKRVFVKKVISLRGSRTTNQVVRDFWLASRGTKFAYAS